MRRLKNLRKEEEVAIFLVFPIVFEGTGVWL